ncbi:MAG TPA: cupredoxin domain-containing protein [Baekduia sp.]
MTHRARRGAALAAVLAAGAAVALPALSPAAPVHAKKHQAGGKTREVGVESDFYDPGKLTIHVGDRVKWVWHASGLSLHDVYVDSGPTEFNSPTQAAGTFSQTFKKAGTYRLYCTQHESDMTMTLVVKKAPR